MEREDVGEGSEHQDAAAEGGQAGGDDEGTAGPSPDLVASTVEALRARLDGSERDALRGTIDPPPSLGPGNEPPAER